MGLTETTINLIFGKIDDSFGLFNVSRQNTGRVIDKESVLDFCCNILITILFLTSHKFVLTFYSLHNVQQRMSIMLEL